MYTHLSPFTGLVAASNLKVAFYVQKTITQTDPGVVTFQNVITAVGGVWNFSFHNFVLPATGMYMFHLTILAYNDIAATYIRSDSTNIQAAYSQRGSQSASALVVMQFAEMTEMSCWMGIGSLWGSGSFGPYVHFSGFLLYQM